MKQGIQQINLAGHIAIDIKIWNGCIELHSHPELSVKIDAGPVSNMRIIPELRYADDRITISHQSFSSVLANSNAIKIKIYVPDESIVRFHQAAGHIWVSGSYKSLHVKNWLGDVHACLNDLFVREEASLEVISGDVYIRADDHSDIRSRSGYEHYQLFKFYNGGSLKAHSYIGEVKWNPYYGKEMHHFA